jgi:putative transcriptional regulator
MTKPVLTGQFLIASTKLTDPVFVQAVVLIVRHDADGAFGFVINKPTGVTVAAALSGVLDEAADIDAPVYNGGPCDGPAFVAHTDPAIGGEQPAPGLFVTTDRDALRLLILTGSQPIKLFATYSGWSPGQLEAELLEGSWSVSPANTTDFFNPTATLWQRLMGRVQLSQYIHPDRIPTDPTVN